MRRLALAFALALALGGVLPTAGADHVFSHRVLVVGRILDVDGQPVPGVRVDATFTGVSVGGICFDAKPAVTSPRGDYEICRHAHAFGSDARVNVSAEGSSREVALDPDLRHAVANLRLDRARAARDFEGDIEFARTVQVVGRAFTLLPAPENAEGVMVNASPLGGNVSVELRLGNETLARKNASANEHGFYSAKLDLEAVPAGTLARVRLGPDVTEVPVDLAFRRADANIVRDLRLLDGPGDDAPGSSVPGGAWAAMVALAAAALTCAGARRPRSRG